MLRVYLAIAALVASFGAGVLVHKWKVDADRLEAERLARETSKALQRGANQAEANYLDRVRDEKDRQAERARQLERRLASSGQDLSRCLIDADTLRVLNSELPGVAGNAAGDRPGSAGVAAGSDCSLLARAYDQNHSANEACVTQLAACRVFYRDVRSRYCAETKAC